MYIKDKKPCEANQGTVLPCLSNQLAFKEIYELIHIIHLRASHHAVSPKYPHLLLCGKHTIQMTPLSKFCKLQNFVGGINIIEFYCEALCGKRQ